MTTYVVNGDETSQQLAMYQQMLFNDWSRGVGSTVNAANNPIAQSNAQQIVNQTQYALQSQGGASNPVNSFANVQSGVTPGAAAATGGWLDTAKGWLGTAGNAASNMIPGVGVARQISSLPSIPNATFIAIGIVLALGALLISQRETVIKVATTAAAA